MTMLCNAGAHGSSGVDTGDIGHSLRCRGAAAAGLSRTFSSSINPTLFTVSFFLKRGTISVQSILFGENAGNQWGLALQADDTLALYLNSSVVGASTAKLRDPTSHVHIVWQVNGTSNTFWMNNLQIASFTATNTRINTAIAHSIMRNTSGGTPTDGYVSRFCLVDGQALTPSSFGYFNTEINEWVSKSQSAVKAVVDAGGTNSFMLDFDNGTSLTTLGYDKSSKGNNWTLNNFSLTAGTSYDWMLDVPGNSFCTGNPLNTMLSSAYTEGNLKIGTSAATLAYLHACSQAMTTGKWYFEATLTGYAAGSGAIGLFKSSASLDAASPGGYANTNWYGYCNNGQKFNGATQVAYGATYNATTPDVVACAYDADAGSVEFFKNGVSQGVAFTGVTGGAYPCFMAYNGTYFVLCTGQGPLHASATYDSASGGYFRYTPPTGYKALCQRNMPDPAILNPEKHFDVDTYTGTGSAINRTGFSLQPDFVWIKGRASAYTHALFDSVRGITKVLNSNTTDAEATEAGGAGLTALNSDGYSLGTNAADASTNVNTQTFAAWLWKAGGAAVTNNAGSISSQVSANVEAGFSIVTYTGTGANATVGHGLGKAPGLVIVKSRSFGGYSWTVYNQSLTAGYVLFMETTSAQTSRAIAFNSTSPTSSVFSLGTDIGTNQNTSTFVAYCFAEIPGFSKIFSYTGNGSADGPFVHCGFKPKFILYKRSDVAANWVIWDSLRSPDNVVNDYLLPNSSAAEAALDALDILSNGFKLRTTNADNNGGTIVGIAFADVSGKYSLGR